MSKLITRERFLENLEKKGFELRLPRYPDLPYDRYEKGFWENLVNPECWSVYQDKAKYFREFVWIPNNTQEVTFCAARWRCSGTSDRMDTWEFIGRDNLTVLGRIYAYKVNGDVKSCESKVYIFNKSLALDLVGRLDVAKEQIEGFWFAMVERTKNLVLFPK